MGEAVKGGSPAVSVILPTHNRAHLLGRGIQSILGQSFTDLELLVVDDASSDGTLDVVKAFRDERVRYIKLASNVGGGAARNAGVSQARAPVIAFQDSDDIWLPQKLERCMERLEREPGLIGVFSAFWQIEGRSAVYRPAGVPEQASMAVGILRENFIDTPTSVIRRTVFEQAGGFDPGLPRYQDWELFIRLLRRGAMAYINEPLVLSFVTPGSISTDSRAHGVAMGRIYEKHASEIVQDENLNASWLANMGDSLLRAGDVTEGRRKLLRSLRIRPFHPGMLLRLSVAWIGGQTLYARLSRFLERCRRGR